MLRRVPPVVLALCATVLLVTLGVTVIALVGGGRGPALPSCSAALARGPYGCIVFVSIDGSAGGREAAQPRDGGVQFRIERRGGADRIVTSGGCNVLQGPVEVTAARFRIGETASGLRACREGMDRDAWAAALLQGEVAVRDLDDSTVELARGDRRARFAQTIVPRS